MPNLGKTQMNNNRLPYNVASAEMIDMASYGQLPVLGRVLSNSKISSLFTTQRILWSYNSQDGVESEVRGGEMRR